MLTRKERQTIRGHKKSLNVVFIKIAEDTIKSAPLWIEDLNLHFKKDKWPLSYSYYLNESKIVPDTIFNIIIKKLGYKMGFNKNCELRIYKPRE